ncbi:MAG: cyclic nucleotide-binding domain-containing protein [bacterium]|nr:cyclic nucleotide-binding domain-containing protein [bacterium]
MRYSLDMLWRRRPSPEIERALARVKIFSTLPPRDLRKLAGMCLLRSYAAGDFILEEGSTGLGLFLVTAGTVEVFKTRDGEKVPLAVLGRGDVLGEMALLDNQPRSATAVALEGTECLLLSRDQFRTLLKRRPRIAWPIVPALTARIRDLQDQLLAAERPPTPAAVEKASPEAPETPPLDQAPVPAASSATAAETVKETAESAADPGSEGSEAGLLRTQVALMMTGAVGFGESARLLEVFVRRLDQEAGLSDERSLLEVARDFPSGLFAAGRTSWSEGLKVPSKMLQSFRDHLRKPRDE